MRALSILQAIVFAVTVFAASAPASSALAAASKVRLSTQVMKKEMARQTWVVANHTQNQKKVEWLFK
jgi:hypothetical protein